MIPWDTKLIRGDFISWNFRFMEPDLPYKLAPAPKAVIQSINIIPTRNNMFVNDNIVIYMNVKKDKTTTKRSRDATKWILGGSLSGCTFDFRFRILNIFSLNGTEISSKPVSYSKFFVWWRFRKSRFHCIYIYINIYIYIYIYLFIWFVRE